MKQRLIDANALREKLEAAKAVYARHAWYDKGVVEAMDRAIAYVSREEDSPTVDAEPVRHGHWEIADYQNKIYTATCSLCKRISNVEHNYKGKPMFYEYCPHCGAKMDKDSDLNPCKEE